MIFSIENVLIVFGLLGQDGQDVLFRFIIHILFGYLFLWIISGVRSYEEESIFNEKESIFNEEESIFNFLRDRVNENSDEMLGIIHIDNIYLISTYLYASLVLVILVYFFLEGWVTITNSYRTVSDKIKSNYYQESRDLGVDVKPSNDDVDNWI